MDGPALLQRGLAQLRIVGIRYHPGGGLALRVEALLAKDVIKDAVSAATECLAVVEDTGER